MLKVPIDLSLDKTTQVGDSHPIEGTRDILTPEQAADYLQVNRETVYRYIRQGKLAASRLGGGYRIPRRSLEFLLWTTRSRPDISLRDYTGEEIAVS